MTIRWTALSPLCIPAVLLAVLLLLAAASPALAQDGAGDGGSGDGQVAPGDSTEQGQGNGEGEEEGQEGQTGRQPSGRFRRAGAGAASLGGLHPTYRLTHDVDQDVSSWVHNFNLAYPLTGRIGITASSDITIRENAPLNRTNRQESWNAGIDIGVTDALTTGIGYTRTTQVDVRNQGASNEVRSFHEREGVSLRTAYKKIFMSGLDVSLGATGGLEKSKYADVQSRGAVQRINASLAYEAPLGVKTNFTYGGNHSLLKSEQRLRKSMDESFAHNLNGHVEYVWVENQFTVDLARNISKTEYPKEQRTERRASDMESIDIGSVLKLVTNLDTKVNVSYSRNKDSYFLEPSNNNSNTTRSAKATLAYTLGATTFTGELQSEKKRDEYFSAETGNSYSESIGSTIAHSFSDRVKASLRGRMGLLSHHYEDTVANDQDRDLFDREANLQVDYSPKPGIRSAVVLRVKEDQLIYIRGTRSANNKVTQTYSVSPSLAKDLGPRMTVAQKYELSADYTFYTYNEDSNFLIRNFSVLTVLDWRPFDPLKLSIEHRFRAQDEGAYVKDATGAEGYGKNSERNDNSMKIGLKYQLWGAVDFDASQELSFQKKWTFNDGQRKFSWEKFDMMLTGRASVNYTLADGSKLKLSLGRTRRDATTILDRQRQVWNISLSIDRTF
jgi:hypothetical protein